MVISWLLSRKWISVWTQYVLYGLFYFRSWKCLSDVLCKIWFPWRFLNTGICLKSSVCSVFLFGAWRGSRMNHLRSAVRGDGSCNKKHAYRMNYDLNGSFGWCLLIGELAITCLFYYNFGICGSLGTTSGWMGITWQDSAVTTRTYVRCVW